MTGHRLSLPGVCFPRLRRERRASIDPSRRTPTALEALRAPLTQILGGDRRLRREVGVLRTRVDQLQQLSVRGQEA